MSKRILAIDDNERLRRMLETRLIKMGYDVLLAASGKQALAILQKEEIDLVLLDQQMPEMDGMETFEHIKDLGIAHLPVIMLTAHGSLHLVLAYMKAGGTDFLEKPIDFDMLSVKLNSAINAHEKIKREIDQRKKAEDALREANKNLELKVEQRTSELYQSREQLRALAAHLQTVREDERTHVAREIHDEMAQVFTAIKMDLFMFREKLSAFEASKTSVKKLLADIDKMIIVIDNTIPKVRQLIEELRPDVLDKLGLMEALRWQADSFTKRTGIKYQFHSDLDTLDVDNHISIALFRISQEALTNIARHARASEIEFKISRKKQDVILTISDNGIGISEEPMSEIKSFGLLGMKERALILGGELNISSKKNSGTTLQAIIPVN